MLWGRIEKNLIPEMKMTGAVASIKAFLIPSGVLISF